MATALETAVVLVVEPHGGPLTEIKARFNAPSIASGMPVHLTVLYPFVSPSELNDGVYATVAAVASRHGELAFALSTISQFPGGFVCLDPDPAAPVDALMADLWAAFPDYPPYGGEIVRPHPHVTVGKADPAADAPDLATTIEHVIRDHRPYHYTVAALTVMARDDAGAWRPLRTVPLTG